jgi:SAM-dependent methyltransferase
MDAGLRVLPQDRTCPGWALDNFLRRRLAPPGRDVDLLGVRHGMVVADIGAGAGFHLPALARAVGPGGRIIAADVDPRNLARARARGTGVVPSTFLLRPAAVLPEVADGVVDRALLSLVLCCLVDKDAAISELWRILAPGGRALVTFPRRTLPEPTRRRGLGLGEERFRRLITTRPWQELPVRRGLLVHRHLLGKPDPSHATRSGS